MAKTLRINEIFYSIQGESTWAGLPCVFVRLTGCPLRCAYCDTAYAFYEGDHQSLEAIITQIKSYGCNLVEITGGEPLLQPNVHQLMAQLCDLGYDVLLETSGACTLSACDPRVIRILDIKTPGSGEVDKNLWANLDKLTLQDEVKFVLTSQDDYQWAVQIIKQYSLAKRVKSLLFGAVAAMPAEGELAGCASLSAQDLAQWILEDKLPVRMQAQLHKMIWDPMTRGV